MMREDHRAPTGLRAWLPHAVVLGAAVVIVVAAFLPWAQAGDDTYYGIGDPRFGVAGGALALLLSLIAGVAAVAALTIRRGRADLVRAGAGWIGAVIGLILAAVGFTDVVDVDDPANFSEPLADGTVVAVDSGLWLTAIFGLVMLLGGLSGVLLRR